jgi:hypothetical protein
MKPINDRVPIKIGKETLQFPSGWHHLTLAQTLLIYNPATGEKGILDVLSILVGKPTSFWFSVDRMDIERHLVPHIAWFNKPFDFQSLPLPPTITIDGKEMKVPKDLGFKSWGQRMAFAQELTTNQATFKDSPEPERNFQFAFGLIPYTLALYFYEQFTGTKFADEFDDDKLREFANEKCVHVPITVAYPIAAFFLRNSTD